MKLLILISLFLTLCLFSAYFADAKMIRHERRYTGEPKARSEGQSRDPTQYSTKLERLMRARSTPIKQRYSSPASYMVAPGTLPGLSPSIDITHYSGYITINETSDANLFFWFIQGNSSNPLDLPLLVWINGGPGCSSMDGLFIENGPFRIQSTGSADDDFVININPSSWHNSANILYIDEPVGTGFSYVLDPAGYVRGDSDLELDFYIFLQEFLGIFTDYATLPLYMSGESFAGHYLPLYGNYILEINAAIANKSVQTNDIILNLQGLAIGNGWTHPITQYDSYAKMGYASGIISLDQFNAYQPLVAACQEQINNGVYDSDECDNVLGQLSDDSGSNSTTQVNVYDYRLYDSSGGVNWPTGIFNEQAYLSLQSVRNASHIFDAPVEWAECNGTASQFLTNTDESTLHLFPYLLSNLRVLVYNGQFDIICNHVGTQEYLNAMEWDGSEEWNAAPRYVWSAEKDGYLQTAGYVKGPVQNLTFLLVLGGSHMVPMDQPEYTFNMITTFLSNSTYEYAEQSAGVAAQPTTPTKSSPLSVTAWILIIVSSFVVGIIIGTVTIALYFRKRHSYSRIN